ncbi:MAG: NERD domain-containing protein/DEAD/DEAH box helicase [Cyclobacteriaceae bacterium]
MARMLPPYVDKTCKSSGEKKVFDILKNSPFTKEWIVLHSLNLAEHSRRLYGEIDFLILIPNAGVFVMEVKGGDVKCKDGVWEFTNRYGRRERNKNPFTQASDAMFSLRKAIIDYFGFGHRFAKIQFGSFVSFPQIHFDIKSVEYKPWQIHDEYVINAGSENFFKNLVNQFTEKHKNETWFSITDSLPTKEVLEELSHFLRGDFERIRTIKDRLAEFDKEVKAYTTEQFIHLDSIERNARCLIQGSAGTGKTMMAIESAIRAAYEGKSVLLTCYNRLIGDWMKKQVDDWRDKITVGHLHGYLFEVSRGFNYETDQQKTQDFYTVYLPNLLGDIFKKGIIPKFDKLIIDEGQDLIREEYINLFDVMIDGGLAKGNWEIYGDFERQAIYAQLSKDDMLSLLNRSSIPSQFLLRRNCRNTKQIGEETSLISGFEKPPFLLEHLEGIPVEYLFYKNDLDQNLLLEQHLNKLISNRISPGELVILSPRTFQHSSASALTRLPIREIKSLNEFVTQRPFFGFATIQSFKGMESNYIIITDIKDISSEMAKSLLYVGMSRARYGLTLLIAEDLRGQYRDILKKKLN